MPLVFLVRKKTLASHITRHITPQLHPVTRFGTGIASGGPALQKLGQQKPNIGSMLSVLCAQLSLDWNIVGPVLM